MDHQSQQKKKKKQLLAMTWIYAKTNILIKDEF